jgi:ankyrin repeat protein
MCLPQNKLTKKCVCKYNIKNKVSMVKFLLHSGADATATDRHHASPFWHACSCGRFNNAVLLATKVSTRELRTPQGRDGTTPAQAASRNQHHALAAWVGSEINRRLKSKGLDSG